MPEIEEDSLPDLEDGLNDFSALEEELPESSPLVPEEPTTPQARADEAVKNALLEKRKWKTKEGRENKIHNISDAHTIVWNEITADGRSNKFQVISLLWVLLQPPKRVIKLGALNTSALRAQVLQFMLAEKIEGERFDELEDCLVEMMKENEDVQTKPADDEANAGK